MNGYTCPACANGDTPDEFCHHTPRQWELAEALRDGIERAHPEGAHPWSPLEGASLFIDDAEAIDGEVGEPPYSVGFTHPGGNWATIGLVNARYLIGCEDVEGETVMSFLGDLADLIPASLLASRSSWEDVEEQERTDVLP